MLRHIANKGPALSRQIITVLNPKDLAALREKSAEVVWPLTQKTHAIIQSMIQAVKAKGVAAGLAAPQIGFQQNIILCSFDRSFESLEVMINPRYEPLGDQKVEGWEGCFSVPRSMAIVARWESIKASYYKPSGDRVDQVLEGKAARIFQHEYGHLKGELIIDIAKVLKTFETEEAYQVFLQIIRTEEASKTPKLQP
ncbi:MAG: peptide deformylase [Gammaproteobacteria bacterium]|nr:peptide deformylase [Gammaproteobacteria bacterium]MBP9728791.1 peptide deformylase [Gammaproteobacteria bacterium]